MRRATLVITIPDVHKNDELVRRRGTVMTIDANNIRINFDIPARIGGRKLKKAFIEHIDFASGGDPIPKEDGRVLVREEMNEAPLLVIGHLEYEADVPPSETSFRKRLATATNRIVRKI